MKKGSKDSTFSVDAEPWLDSGQHHLDPSESLAPPLDANPNEIDVVRDSVFSEPNRQGASEASEFGEWMAKKQSQASRTRSLAITLLVALIGGPFAIIGAIMTGRPTASALVYIVLFGPVTEELLKQSGMIHLLERRPYHVFSKWQLIIGAVIAAGLFATIENLIYIHVYLAHLPADQLESLSAFRWLVCTSLHIACSLIASIGMVKVWQRHRFEGKPADLSEGYRYFVVAIAVHGTYNLIAVVTHSMGFF